MARRNSSHCRILIILLLASFLWTTTAHPIARARRQQTKTLRIPAGKPSFKIAMFADLHFGEDAWTDWGPLQDVLSTGLISSVLDTEKPDFAVYLGDVITANNIAIGNASAYWDQAIAPTRERRIPWATVFGNHDDAKFEWPAEWNKSGIPEIKCPPGGADCSFKGTSRVELMRKEVEKDGKGLSFSGSGPASLLPSVSNYVIPVGSSGVGSPPVLLMYFLDSGGGSYPGGISAAQTAWLQGKFRELNPDSRLSFGGEGAAGDFGTGSLIRNAVNRRMRKSMAAMRRTAKEQPQRRSHVRLGRGRISVAEGEGEADSIPEIVFWHIPSKAYATVAPARSVGVASPCVGSINAENVAPQDQEVGATDMLSKRTSVKAVFTGHNHGLDWCCPYQNRLWLCYARHSGYGGYGSWSRGVRMVEVTEKPFSIKSWIAMDDGTTHSQITLSS
ncbi:Probable inactive purple acid phosphatase 16 [Linum perenne]